MGEFWSQAIYWYARVYEFGDAYLWGNLAGHDGDPEWGFKNI
jgi:hypothetical protein